MHCIFFMEFTRRKCKLRLMQLFPSPFCWPGSCLSFEVPIACMSTIKHYFQLNVLNPIKSRNAHAVQAISFHLKNNIENLYCSQQYIYVPLISCDWFTLSNNTFQPKAQTIWISEGRLGFVCGPEIIFRTLCEPDYFFFHV